jgi:hypothetical protein
MKRIIALIFWGMLAASALVWAAQWEIGAPYAYDPIRIAPSPKGSGSFVGTITTSDLTAARTFTFPNASLALAAPVDGYLVASSATGYKTVRDFLVIYQGAARCATASTAISFWNLGAGAATAACVEGTNVLRGTLNYIDTGGNHTAQIPFYLPSDIDLTTAPTFEVYWSTAATTGSAIFNVYTTCVAPNETPDPAYNAAQTITAPADQTANYKYLETIAALTTTGCAGGEVMFVKLDREGGAVDTVNATVSVIATELKYYRKW